MYLIDVNAPFLNAIVPTLGFNISTWSLPWLKRQWMGAYDWNFGRGRNVQTFDEYNTMEMQHSHASMASIEV